MLQAVGHVTVLQVALYVEGVSILYAWGTDLCPALRSNCVFDSFHDTSGLPCCRVLPNRGETRSYCIYLVNNVFTTQVVKTLFRNGNRIVFGMKLHCVSKIVICASICHLVD